MLSVAGIKEPLRKPQFTLTSDQLRSPARRRRAVVLKLHGGPATSKKRIVPRVQCRKLLTDGVQERIVKVHQGVGYTTRLPTTAATTQISDGLYFPAATPSVHPEAPRSKLLPMLCRRLVCVLSQASRWALRYKHSLEDMTLSGRAGRLRRDKAW